MKTYKGYQIRKSDTGGRTMGREVWYIVDGIANSHHTTLKSAKFAIDFVLIQNESNVQHRDAIAQMILNK